MTLPKRPQFEWSLRTRTMPLGRNTAIIGVLNVTPDSFSDGGSYPSPAAAADRASRMFDEGADVVDVGGESTRPGAAAVSSAEEQARVLPVLTAIVKQRRHAILSIDTYHAETARLAVEAGAEIVNDVSGHLWDPRMAETCAELRCGVVLMHTRGRPSQWKTQPSLEPAQVLPLVRSGLTQQVQQALAAGVARDRIVLDPGFGFGKIGRENDPLLAHLDELQQLGFPILAGLSRKSFLRLSSNAAQSAANPAEPGELKGRLLSATLAANTAAILAGAHLLRVHDVAEARAAVAVADRILAAAADR